MTADEIMHVLRLTAMSRVNHPDQQRFCEALEKVFAKGCKCAAPETAVAPELDAVVKRGPGRPKKAE